MTCTECLQLVATADVAELAAAGAVREHCRTCPDCATLVDEVAEESRRLADLLDGTPPGMPAHVVALQAVSGAGRARRRARWRRAAGGAGVVAVTLLGVTFTRLIAPPAAPEEVRTVELRCLAPEQVAELARPHLPPGARVTMRSADRLPVLTVGGEPGDVALAEQAIVRIDARWAAEQSEYCVFRPRAAAPARAP